MSSPISQWPVWYPSAMGRPSAARIPPCVLSIRNCGRPSSRGSQPIPAFCVIPKMSPLGRSISISAVSGRLPAGPEPTVSTRHSAGSESTICSNRRVSVTLTSRGAWFIA